MTSSLVGIKDADDKASPGAAGVVLFWIALKRKIKFRFQIRLSQCRNNVEGNNKYETVPYFGEYVLVRGRGECAEHSKEN